MYKKILKNKDGFTLVELLVVIAILAVLASVSVVGYLGFTTKARNSNAVTELTQVREVIRANLIDGDTHTYKYEDNKATEVESLESSKVGISLTYNLEEKKLSYTLGTGTVTTDLSWSDLLKAVFTDLSDLGTLYVTSGTESDTPKTITTIGYKSKSEGYAIWTIGEDSINTSDKTSAVVNSNNCYTKSN